MALKDIIFSKPSSTFAQPFVIAEVGVNHEGNMDLARRLIDEAQEGGADAVKFQSYKAETIAMRESPSYWDTQKEPTTNQFDLFKKYDKFWKNEFEQLKRYCDKSGIEFLSTPFDLESVDYLNDLMQVYKISSSDITNLPFIESICRKGKPILLSTGASDLEEIQEAVGWISKQGNALALMHCVLNYPTQERDANLGQIEGLRENFSALVIGYSDHTFPEDMKTLELAVWLGAQILEKHFTFDKTLRGNDHFHSMDKEDLKVFRRLMDRDVVLYGSAGIRALPQESLARQNARRSLVAKQDIAQGSVITLESLTWKRPASGISPREIDQVVGKRALKDIPRDAAIQKNMLR